MERKLAELEAEQLNLSQSRIDQAEKEADALKRQLAGAQSATEILRRDFETQMEELTRERKVKWARGGVINRLDLGG